VATIDMRRKLRGLVKLCGPSLTRAMPERRFAHDKLLRLLYLVLGDDVITFRKSLTRLTQYGKPYAVINFASFIVAYEKCVKLFYFHFCQNDNVYGRTVEFAGTPPMGLRLGDVR